MKTLSYKIAVEAPVAKLWYTLTDMEPYEKWIKVFSENSTMHGTWGLGEIVIFSDPSMGGTKAKITEFEKEKIIVAEHIAMVTKGGVEEITGEMTEKWIGTIEKYILTEVGTRSHLEIEILTHPDFVEMFENSWPKAMKDIKKLTEM